MTCTDARELLGPFIDAELPSPMLLAVARHAASCAACDTAIRDLTDLHEAVAGAIQSAADGLDLSGVWSHVEAAAVQHDAKLHRQRQLHALPLWGSIAALAASVLVWIAVNGIPHVTSSGHPRDLTMQVAAKSRDRARPHTEIDRLAGRVASFGREPKTGTPIIWVDYTPSTAR